MRTPLVDLTRKPCLATVTPNVIRGTLATVVTALMLILSATDAYQFFSFKTIALVVGWLCCGYYAYDQWRWVYIFASGRYTVNGKPVDLSN
jgi:hypothetical protein